MTYTHEKIVNISIVYEISKNYNISSYPTLKNCLSGAVSLTKIVDFGKYKYSGYGIGSDRHGFFSYGGGTSKNVIISGVDNISSAKIDNKKRIF